MSRKLQVVVFSMLVLLGAMGLKAVLVAHSDSAVMMAVGSAPEPPGN